MGETKNRELLNIFIIWNFFDKGATNVHLKFILICNIIVLFLISIYKFFIMNFKLSNNTCEVDKFMILRGHSGELPTRSLRRKIKKLH